MTSQISGVEDSQTFACQREAIARRVASPGPDVASGSQNSANTDRKRNAIAILAVAGIAVHLLLRFGFISPVWLIHTPLLLVLVVGGGLLVIDLIKSLFRGQFGSDLLAGISIVVSIILQEYLAGSIVVLMLAGGQALEAYASRRASSVLRALAGRMPLTAHRTAGLGFEDVPLSDVRPGDTLVVFPHEICPVDGKVMSGHGVMDESYLTGEPFQMSKAPGSEVLSGAINGEAALTIHVSRPAIESRYSQIIRVMRASEQDSPRLRRLGDRLGAWYTPFALLIAMVAWLSSGSANRFLAVLVIATPCPLLIAIPVAIIGAISLCARNGIIVKKPAVLEYADDCRTLIFDKTGTLTYGEPRVSEILPALNFDRDELLALTASLERYSKHPLARAVLLQAESLQIPIPEATEINEPPGQGLRGIVNGRRIEITSRKRVQPESKSLSLPPPSPGLECIVLIDQEYAGLFRFRDEPRGDTSPFIGHLGRLHGIHQLMIVSGDQEPEVRYLANAVGIQSIYAGQSPEEKLEIVRRETKKAKTLYLGDGINDAPALLAATVGVAMGQNSDITSEAAGAVILDRSLKKVDEFLHISRRMKRIALQSAVGGMALSGIGMAFALAGYLPPIMGAICQEIIDVLAVLNALRAGITIRKLSDF